MVVAAEAVVRGTAARRTSSEMRTKYEKAEKKTCERKRAVEEEEEEEGNLEEEVDAAKDVNNRIAVDSVANRVFSYKNNCVVPVCISSLYFTQLPRVLNFTDP
jgi:hypothetical protein